MSESIYFAPIRTPFVDIRTGVINRDWYLFLLAMFNRVGGTIGPTPDDVAQSIAMGIDAANVQAVQAAQNDAFSVGPLPIIPQPSFDDVVTELQQTRELVAKLMTCIQAIQQGVPVL
jgi:hypothetical protein